MRQVRLSGKSGPRACRPASFAPSLRPPLRDAAFPELPINLHRAGGMVELEVSVLGQRKFVSSRPGFEPASSTTQAAFADLLKRLADLPSSCN